MTGGMNTTFVVFFLLVTYITLEKLNPKYMARRRRLHYELYLVWCEDTVIKLDVAVGIKHCSIFNGLVTTGGYLANLHRSYHTSLLKTIHSPATALAEHQIPS